VSFRPTFTCVLHGESGIGKSWLADTVPAPRLICDVEQRAKHTPSGPKVWWDPLTQSPPVADGSWETCVVKCTSFSILNKVYEWLRSGQHPFRSVVIDSLMEAQKRWMDEEVGNQQMQTQNWGAVLRALESLVRNMRDLVEYEAAHTDVVVIVTGSVPDDRGIARPLLQGQLKNTLPYYVDVVAWYSVQPSPTDPTQFVRALNVGPTPFAVAKDGTGKLGGPVIYEPNFTALFNQLTQPQEATAA
jgi:hypothetical protein